MNTDKQVEELLKPRYKVIADYPYAAYKVGDIINTYESAMAIALNCEKEDCKICLKDYPQLFKKLEWFERRQAPELPDYLKDEHGEVWKVYQYLSAFSTSVNLYKNFKDEEMPYGSHSLYELKPATISEYNDFIKKQKL